MTKVGSHGKLAQPAIWVINGEYQERNFCDCNSSDVKLLFRFIIDPWLCDYVMVALVLL